MSFWFALRFPFHPAETAKLALLMWCTCDVTEWVAVKLQDFMSVAHFKITAVYLKPVIGSRQRHECKHWSSFMPHSSCKLEPIHFLLLIQLRVRGPGASLSFHRARGEEHLRPIYSLTPLTACVWTAGTSRTTPTHNAPHKPTIFLLWG